MRIAFYGINFNWTVISRIFLLTNLLVFIHQTSFAGEYIEAEKPHPESVDEMSKTLGDEAFEGKKKGLLRRGILLPYVRKKLEELPPIWRDTRLGFNFRTFDFNRKNLDGRKPEAWAVGGELEYESGEWNEFFSAGAGLYTSNEIFASGGDGTLLLGPDQSNITVLGKAYAQFRYQDFYARLYRQTFNLPYLNKNDSRMIPNSHEAYILRGARSNLNFIIGHVTDMKQLDSDRFISMSEAAGVPGSDEGLTMGGGQVHLEENLTIGAVDYYSWDVMNIFYSELDYTGHLTEQLGIKFSAQFTHQESIDDELLGPFSTNSTGVLMALSYRSVVLTLAGSTTSDNARIRSPYGGRPGYLDLMRFSFDRAGENGFLVGLSYNFRWLGFEELSAFTNIAHGIDAVDPDTNTPLPDRTEYDFTVDYYPKRGILKDFWLRLRAAWGEEDGSEHTARDFRAILNYRINIL